MCRPEQTFSYKSSLYGAGSLFDIAPQVVCGWKFKLMHWLLSLQKGGPVNGRENYFSSAGGGFRVGGGGGGAVWT